MRLGMGNRPIRVRHWFTSLHFPIPRFDEYDYDYWIRNSDFDLRLHMPTHRIGSQHFPLLGMKIRNRIMSKGVQLPSKRREGAPFPSSVSNGVQ